MKKVAYVLGLMNAEKSQTLVMVYDAYQIKESLKADGYKWDASAEVWYKVIDGTDIAAETEHVRMIANGTMFVDRARVKGSPLQTQCQALKARVFG